VWRRKDKEHNMRCQRDCSENFQNLTLGFMRVTDLELEVLKNLP